MAGLSDKAIKPNYAENKFRYNGGNEKQDKEFSDGSGWEMYDAGFRMYDQQTGRFGQVDPLADAMHFFSTYQFAGNNPISMNDPLGLKQIDPSVIAKMHQLPIGGAGGADPNAGMEEAQENVNENFAYQDAYLGVPSGMFGNGQYASYYQDIWDNSPGNASTVYSSIYSDGGPSKLYNNYINACGTGTFDTPNWDGEETFQPDMNEKYYFFGTSTHTALPAYEGIEEGGWEKASVINEALDLSLDGTEGLLKGAQQIAYSATGQTGPITDLGAVGKYGGRVFALAGLAISMEQGFENQKGWQNHNTADVAYSAITVILSMAELSNPIGWGVLAFQGLYFLGGEWYKGTHNGQSITEAIFDK